MYGIALTHAIAICGRRSEETTNPRNQRSRLQSYFETELAGQFSIRPGEGLFYQLRLSESRPLLSERVKLVLSGSKLVG